MGFTTGHTGKAVRYVSYTILLFLIVDALFVVVLVALFPFIALVSTIDPATLDPNDPTLANVLGAAFALLAGVCVILIVGLIGLIFGILGLVSLNRGKQEFGTEHSQRVDRAIIVVILGVIAPIIGGLAIGAGTFLTATPGVQDFSLASTTGSTVVGIIAVVLVGLFLLWSIESLATPKLRQLGLYALVAGILSAVSSGALTLGLIATTPVPTTPQEFTLTWLLPGILGYVISVVSLSLWYMAYRGVLRRFASGELRAAVPPPYMPAPGAYPPGYWPPAQQVPPPQPPPEPPRPPGP